VPGPVRRPQKGEGLAGDFVDGETKPWDVKAEKSREKLIEKIKADAAAKGRPEPRLDPSKKVKGEFNLNTTLGVIEHEFQTNERVMLDMRGLNDADAKALRDAITEKAKIDPKWKDWVRLWP
jgi:hypothetical protein